MTTLPIVAERSCQPCRECCIKLGVKELQKPPGVACVHLDDVGCTIYAERPPTCAGFACMWLRGMVPLDLKPDACGIVFVGSADNQRLVAYLDWDLPLDGATPALDLLYGLAKEWPETFAVQGSYVTKLYPDGGMETRLHGIGWKQ